MICWRSCWSGPGTSCRPTRPRYCCWTISSGQLIATAAAGLEEEVRQGVRIPVGRGFAGRIAAEHKPVILDHVDHTTVLNPILLCEGDPRPDGRAADRWRQGDRRLHVGSLTPREFTSEDARTAAAGRRPGGHGRAVADRAREDRIAAAALQRSLLPSALPVIPAGADGGPLRPGRGRGGRRLVRRVHPPVRASWAW